MIIEVEGLHRDYLERIWKLMLILREDQTNNAWPRQSHY